MKLFQDSGIDAKEEGIHSGRRRSKGYAFVNVGNEAEHQKAIEALNGKKLEDGKGNERAIAVKVAVDGQGEGEDKENAAPAPEGEAVKVEEA